VTRGWQMKRVKRLDWAALRTGLAAAVTAHSMAHVTYCFSMGLTAIQRARFAEYLQAPHPDLTVDYWDADELTARLTEPTAAAIVERFFDTPPDRLCTPTKRDDLPRLAGMGWQDLGVARAGLVADAEGQAHKIERAEDRELRSTLAGWKEPSQETRRPRLIVVSGPVGCGKTRSLHDALKDALPESALVLMPADHEEARRIASGWETPDRGDDRLVVLWLDDLERFVRINESGLTGAMLHRMLRRDPRLLIAATCHGKGVSLLPPDERAIDTMLDTIVDSAGLHLRIDHLAREEDLDAVRDAISAEDLQEIASLGIGPFVLGIGRLDDRVERTREPSRLALVEAALAWGACGISAPISREELWDLWERRVSTKPTRELFDAALDWALEPVVGRVALLFRAEQGYVAPGLLAERFRARIDVDTVMAVLEMANADQAGEVAYRSAGLPAAEEAIAQFAADERDSAKLGVVCGGFGVSLIENGERPRALPWLTRADELGDVQGTRNLGIYLYRRGLLEEAKVAFARADALGDAAAATNLAALLAAEGREEEGLAALRRGDERGCDLAAFNLAQEMDAQGDAAATRAALSRSIERGNAAAPSWLGLTLLEDGDMESAEGLLQLGDERGDPVAAYNLGVLLLERGDTGPAEDAFRRADDRGDPDGAFAVGVQLRPRNLDAAIRALRRADDREHPEAPDMLGLIWEAQGDLDAAEAAYRRADERGSGGGAAHLAVLLNTWGATEEAEEALRRADARGDIRGAENLGVLLLSRGDPDGAAVLARADDQGSGYAALGIGAHLAEEEDYDAAVAALQRALARGTADAGTMLGELYLDELSGQEGSLSLAEKALSRADELGSGDGSYLLAMVLADQERHDEAVEALVRADERGLGAAALSLGGTFADRRDLEGALACFARAEDRGMAEGARQAAELMSQHDLTTEAVTAMRRAHAAGLWGADLDLGLLLAETGAFEEAEQLLLSAVDAGVEEAEDAFAEYTEFVEGVEAELREAAATDPEKAFELGWLLDQRGDTARAENAYRQADSRGSAEGAIKLGALLDERGAHEEALAAYRRAADRHSARGAYFLGVALERTDMTAARDAHALADKLGYGGGSCRLGTLLAEAGEEDEAEAALLRAVDLDHSHGALVHADYLMNWGRPAEAAVRYRVAEQAGLDFASVGLGKASLAAGDREAAKRAFTRADRRGDPNGSLALAHLLIEDRDANAAIGPLRRAEAAGLSAAVPPLGRILMLNGRSRDAEQILRRWHESGNTDATALLAALLFDRGDPSCASFLLGLELGAGSEALRYLRGLALLDVDPAAAARDFSDAAAHGDAIAGHMAEFALLKASTAPGDRLGRDMLNACERGNPIVAHVFGESLYEAGDLDMAQGLLTMAFEANSRAAGTVLANLLDEMDHSDDARAVRERLKDLPIIEEPMWKPLFTLAQAAGEGSGLQWLAEATLTRRTGFPSAAGGEPPLTTR